MQTEETANPAATGYKWTDEGGLPRHTNGAFNPLTNEVKPDAPTHKLTPHVLGPAEQATEDWRQIKVYGADQESLRSKAVARFNQLELLVYSNTIAQLRRPALSNAQTSRNWRRNAPRTAARKAAA